MKLASLKKQVNGAGQMPHHSEHWPLLQKTWFQVPAPTQLRTIPVTLDPGVLVPSSGDRQALHACGAHKDKQETHRSEKQNFLK